MLSDLLTRLVRPMLSRSVTSAYPRSIDLPPSVRGLPLLDQDRCDGTAACVAACPTGAIAFTVDGGGTWSIDAGRCIFCRACQLGCPVDAISMTGGVELATAERAATVTSIRVGKP